MTMVLGGRAAEQLVFGSITIGAADDLRRVAGIAHAMIHDFAMGTGFTSLRLAAPDASDSTRRQTNAEVHELTDQALRAAVAIIEAHRAQLDELAATLLAQEVIERVDIERIMSGVPGSRSARRGQGHLELAAATAMDPARPRLPRS